MNRSAHTHRRAIAAHAGQQGVSLIEMMVGMVIGLLATLVISQVASLYESQKRMTTAGSDTQLNGALALHTLQRDIEMGGYGLTNAGLAGCTQITGKRAGTPYNWTMAPVLITQGSGETTGVTGNADSIRVLMSSKTGFVVPMRIRSNHLRSEDTFTLEERSNVGNRGPDIANSIPGDLLLVVPNPTAAGQVTPNWCSLAQINTDPSGDTLTHGTTNGPWNQNSTDTVFPGTTNADISYAAGSYLVNVGNLIDRCFFIAGSSERCGLAAATEAPNTLRLRVFNTNDASVDNQEVYPDMVNMQAVYGKDTSATPDGVVDAWDTTTPTTSAGWAQVIAVRVALLARGSQYDQNEITSALPRWSPTGTSTTKTFTLPSCPAGDSTCWKHYRYRVFETVIPLRNMLWQARQS